VAGVIDRCVCCTYCRHPSAGAGTADCRDRSGAVAIGRCSFNVPRRPHCPAGDSRHSISWVGARGAGWASYSYAPALRGTGTAKMTASAWAGARWCWVNREYQEIVGLVASSGRVDAMQRLRRVDWPVEQRAVGQTCALRPRCEWNWRSRAWLSKWRPRGQLWRLSFLKDATNPEISWYSRSPAPACGRAQPSGHFRCASARSAERYEYDASRHARRQPRNGVPCWSPCKGSVDAAETLNEHATIALASCGHDNPPFRSSAGDGGSTCTDANGQ